LNKILHNTSELHTKLLPILSDEEAGERYSKWSFVNIYSLKDLKDIYLISILVECKTLKEISKKVNELIVSSEKWEERKVLEYLNALVKFELLDSAYNIKKKHFEGSQINSELTDKDCETLRSIFFNYFRFKEISSWFVNPEKEFHHKFDSLTEADYILKSKPLYFYSDKNRFTDTFLTDIEDGKTKYVIESDILMRFWDVYLKWGTTLNILDKFNISKVKDKLPVNKELSASYFIKPFCKFDLIDFITQNFNSRHILIPDLIINIIKDYRYSINEIKSFIVSELISNDKLTYERTSEIFLIKGKTSKKNIEAATYLFPKINNSYISHLILRR
jgi:hypothetical protein